MDTKRYDLFTVELSTNAAERANLIDASVRSQAFAAMLRLAGLGAQNEHGDTDDTLRRRLTQSGDSPVVVTNGEVRCLRTDLEIAAYGLVAFGEHTSANNQLLTEFQALIAELDNIPAEPAVSAPGLPEISILIKIRDINTER